MKHIDEANLQTLNGVETLVINGLRWEKEHHSHILINEAIAFSQQIGAKKTYLVHVTHEIGSHEDVQKQLPKNVFLAYDGLEIEV